jgi:putative ABC transport system substrate-binding protein
LIDFAQRAALSLNMELVVHHASNLSESAKVYVKVLKEMNSMTDSMWLPEDSSTIDTQVVLPMVLKILWEKNLKIFSSGISQVGRGALFGLYPDNYEMGVYVGQLAQKIINKEKIDEPIQPLRQLKSAINIKAMQHVGLPVDQNILSTFTVVLPKDVR